MAESSDYRNLLFRLENGVAEITLNQPDTLNALTTSFGEELLAALARGEREARAILIRANGKGFCSGASLAGDRFDLDDPQRDVGARLDSIYHPLFRQMRNSGVPIVTSVNGAAAGIGCALALAADLIVAGQRGYFYLSFAAIGLVPDGGLVYLLTRAVGRPRATEMLLLGARVSAAQALDWGLINRVVDAGELDATARTLAVSLADGPYSIGSMRRMIWETLDADFPAALAIERERQRDAGRSADLVEGFRAFRERRPARFSGR